MPIKIAEIDDAMTIKAFSQLDVQAFGIDVVRHYDDDNSPFYTTQLTLLLHDDSSGKDFPMMIPTSIMRDNVDSCVTDIVDFCFEIFGCKCHGIVVLYDVSTGESIQEFKLDEIIQRTKEFSEFDSEESTQKTIH